MTTRKPSHESHDADRRADSKQTVEDGPARAATLMESKIVELESALAEARDKHLRLAADFDNYKKRSRQEQVETIQHASADLIGRLLPALDDLHSALDHTPAGIDEAWLKGIELSVRKLEEALGTHGLELIKSVGAAFDPKLHEAIGHEDSTELPEDTVVSELRRGYRIRDRVVRPALVRVARQPELPASDSDSAIR
jgi:molecular chaperone GrpE